MIPKRALRALDAVSSGSAVLARRLGDRITGWVRAGRRDDLTGWRAALGCWGRLALLIGAAWIAWRILRAVPWLMWAITAGWCWAAVRAAPKPAETAEVEGPAGAPAGPDSAAVVALLRDLIGDRKGVHLSTVLGHLQETGHGEGWQVAELRARLAALGVPVRRSLKVAKRVTWGVHRDDLPASPRPDSPGVDRYPSTSA